MVEVMLEIRVSQSASACQCSSRSSWELSTDLSGIQDELTGLQASLCHCQGSHHQPLQREILSREHCCASTQETQKKPLFCMWQPKSVRLLCSKCSKAAPRHARVDVVTVLQ